MPKVKIISYAGPILRNATTQTPTPISPDKQMLSQQNYPPGCIVSINGYDMDYGKFQSRKHAPTFFGTVEDTKNLDFE